jgi:hypothetical protein
MKLVVAVLAALAAAVAAVFFWRKHRQSASPALSRAADSVSSWTKTAAETAGDTTDKIAEKAREAAGT